MFQCSGILFGLCKQHRWRSKASENSFARMGSLDGNKCLCSLNYFRRALWMPQGQGERRKAPRSPGPIPSPHVPGPARGASASECGPETAGRGSPEEQPQLTADSWVVSLFLASCSEGARGLDFCRESSWSARAGCRWQPDWDLKKLRSELGEKPKGGLMINVRHRGLGLSCWQDT